MTSEGHPEPGSKEDTSFKEQTDTPSIQELEDCPDGGLRAWLVVLGVFCGMCATVGLVSAWGTFQAYYQEVKLPHRSPSDIAWIGSVQNAMLNACGLPSGRMFDMGYLKLPILAASALFVACMFLTAECTEYWHLLFCQGFGIGLATGFFFNMTSMVMTHWFKRRLGLALACIYSGASISGCIFPILVKALLQHQSFPWAMRILGFMTLGLLAVTNSTLARRLPGRQDCGPLVNVAEFTKPAYSFYVASLCINMLGLFTVLTYLTVSAVGAGLDSNLSFDLLAIANATSTLGRLGSGLLTDRYGPLNVLIPATLMTGILTYAWPFAKDVTGFVVIAVLVGISTGGILAIFVQPFARMGAVSDIGMRIGMGLTTVVAGVIAGPPISGAILDRTGSFKNVGYYGGSMLVLSASLMVAVGHSMVQAGGVVALP